MDRTFHALVHGRASRSPGAGRRSTWFTPGGAAGAASPAPHQGGTRRGLNRLEVDAIDLGFGEASVGAASRYGVTLKNNRAIPDIVRRRDDRRRQPG
jgi:hypothetical protein